MIRRTIHANIMHPFWNSSSNSSSSSSGRREVSAAAGVSAATAQRKGRWRKTIAITVIQLDHKLRIFVFAKLCLAGILSRVDIHLYSTTAALMVSGATKIKGGMRAEQHDQEVRCLGNKGVDQAGRLASADEGEIGDWMERRVTVTECEKEQENSRMYSGQPLAGTLVQALALTAD